jgi:hypothetical protein
MMMMMMLVCFLFIAAMKASRSGAALQPGGMS